MTGGLTRIEVRLERSGFRLDVRASWSERVAVLFGPSGCGKTTLLESVLGLHRGTRARVELAGHLLEDHASGFRLPLEGRRLGWVPQDPSLLPHLSVEGNLRVGLARAGADGVRHLERAVEVLEIGGLRKRRISELSGGERQRVALARALASGPRALLLDEPLASLDLPLRARVLPFLIRVRDELDLPMLYITHDPDEALVLAQVVIVLDRGRVVASGPAAEVLWSRAVLPLSQALGLENVLEARVVQRRDGGSTVETRNGLALAIPAEVEPGQILRLGVRAEDLLLSVGPPGLLSARNVFPATVSGLEERGNDVLVHLDAGETLIAKVTREAARSLALTPGVRLQVVLKAQAIRRLA